MKHATIALVATANMAAALTQQCSGGSVNEGGNYFCGAVNHILYQGIGGSGSYQKVMNMGPNGECSRETKSFSGPLAPLDEDVSLHHALILCQRIRHIGHPTATLGGISRLTYALS